MHGTVLDPLVAWLEIGRGLVVNDFFLPRHALQDDGSRDPHHNGSVHSNSGMHTSGLLMSTEEEEELRQIRTFHGTIASLQSKCAALETDTFEMEMKVEVRT